MCFRQRKLPYLPLVSKWSSDTSADRHIARIFLTEELKYKIYHNSPVTSCIYIYILLVLGIYVKQFFYCFKSLICKSTQNTDHSPKFSTITNYSLFYPSTQKRTFRGLMASAPQEFQKNVLSRVQIWTYFDVFIHRQRIALCGTHNVRINMS